MLYHVNFIRTRPQRRVEQVGGHDDRVRRQVHAREDADKGLHARRRHVELKGPDGRDRYG